MKVKKLTITLHTVLSGIIAFFFSAFMASGTIAENYTEDIFVAPVFFLILVFWLVSVLFLVFRKFQASVKIMWLSIPIGMVIAFPLATLL